MHRTDGSLSSVNPTYTKQVQWLKCVVVYKKRCRVVVPRLVGVGANNPYVISGITSNTDFNDGVFTKGNVQNVVASATIVHRSIEWMVSRWPDAH